LATPMREYIAPVLALIVGVLVLLPTAIGPVSRPFVWGILLPVFFVLAVISVVALAIAIVASSWSVSWATGVMHRTHGVGNFAGGLSLVAAAVFLWANYAEDISASPRIVNVRINPLQPEAGKMVEVDLEVVNRTGGALDFEWELDGRRVVGLRTAYIKMPERPGNYLVTASVKAASSAHRPETGASAIASTRQRSDSGSLVRVWLEVASADSPGRGAGGAADVPQSIVQVCNQGGQHGRQSQDSTRGTRGPSAASAATAGRC
jgi:hypothetical protein